MHAAIKTQGQGRGGGVICGENFFTHSPFTFSGKYTYKKRKKLNFRNGFYSTASLFPSFSRRLNFIAGKWLRPQRTGVLEKSLRGSVRKKHCISQTFFFPPMFSPLLFGKKCQSSVPPIFFPSSSSSSVLTIFAWKEKGKGKTGVKTRLRRWWHGNIRNDSKLGR